MRLWLARLLLLALPLLFLAGIYLASSSNRMNQNREQGPSVVAACEEKGLSAEGRKCYEDYLVNLMKSQGGEVAVKKMGELEQGSPIMKTYCHGVAHTLGNAGFAHYGSLAEALAHGGMDCFAGYYHGAIEVALQDAPDYSGAVLGACSGLSGRDGEFRFYQCVHGLGHGVTPYRQYDVEQALQDCDLLETGWRRESCGGGVFMENIDSKFVHAMGGERQGRLQDDESDFWPCLGVAEGYRAPCFRMITARILPKHNRSFSYASEACDRLATDAYRRWCFESYGRDAAGEGLHTTLTKVNELCDAAPSDMRDTCYETGAAVVATHFADPERATVICTRAGENQLACERGKARIAQSLAG